MPIVKTLHLVRETKNTYRFDEQTNRDDERPQVIYLPKRHFPSGEPPKKVSLAIEW